MREFIIYTLSVTFCVVLAQQKDYCVISPAHTLCQYLVSFFLSTLLDGKLRLQVPKLARKISANIRENAALKTEIAIA